MHCRGFFDVSISVWHRGRKKPASDESGSDDSSSDSDSPLARRSERGGGPLAKVVKNDLCCKVTTIYKPFRPVVRGVTLLRGLTNHGY